MSIKEVDVYDAELVLEDRIKQYLEYIDWYQLLALGEFMFGADDPDVVEFKETIENWDGDF